MNKISVTDNSLAGVCVGETAISSVGEDGVGLSYRGYAIEELTEHATFEEVCFLLIYKILPNKNELSGFCERLQKRRCLPHLLKLVLQNIPSSAHPMDVLRTGISTLGCLEPESAHNNQFHISERLIAILPSILFYWYHFHNLNIEIDTSSHDPSLADYFLSLLTGKHAINFNKTIMNRSFILYAEHEFNASTFSARVTASTLSDFYSAIVSAIGTLKGKLHGGANEATMELIEQFHTPLEAEQGIKQVLAKKELIMGFGHRVYKNSDPRSAIMKKNANSLAERLKLMDPL